MGSTQKGAVIQYYEQNPLSDEDINEIRANFADVFKERELKEQGYGTEQPTANNQGIRTEGAEVLPGQQTDVEGGGSSLDGEGPEKIDSTSGVNDGDTSTTQPTAEQGGVDEAIKVAGEETYPAPTDAQKEAGNYKKGHVKVAGYDLTIENAAGSTRSGVDANGQKWETTMHNTYGYIRGTEGVDGDHIDVFLSDNVDGWDGKSVFVVDQYNEDGSFDEHKVMLGFNSKEDAFGAYLSNYSKGWAKGRRLEVTEVPQDGFRKWIDSSHRKTKAFSEYAEVKRENTNTGDFGPIFTEYRGDVKGAVARLSQEKGGEAIGALHHEEVGDIDLVWGKEGTGHSDGFGLSKLLKFHPEVVDNLQEILDGMHVVSRSKNRINLESERYKAAIRLTWNDKAKTWLLTAFEKEEATSPTGKRTDTADSPMDLQGDTALLQNGGASSGKSTESKSSTQENSVKIRGFEIKKAEKPGVKGTDGDGMKVLLSDKADSWSGDDVYRVTVTREDGTKEDYVMIGYDFDSLRDAQKEFKSVMGDRYGNPENVDFSYASVQEFKTDNGIKSASGKRGAFFKKGASSEDKQKDVEESREKRHSQWNKELAYNKIRKGFSQQNPDTNPIAKILQENDTAEGAVSELRRLASSYMEQAEDWASRKYKKNGAVVEAKGAADDELSNHYVSIDTANERRRNSRVRYFTESAEELNKFADEIVKKTGVTEENAPVPKNETLEQMAERIDKQNQKEQAKKRRKKFNPISFAMKPRKDGMRSQMTGVYYHDGKMAATDGMVLVEVDGEYDKAYEGSVRDKNGNEVEGKFPKYDSILDEAKKNAVDVGDDHVVASIRKVQELSKLVGKNGEVRFEFKNGHYLASYTADKIGKLQKLLDAYPDAKVYISKHKGQEVLYVEGDGVKALLLATSLGTNLYKNPCVTVRDGKVYLPFYLADLDAKGMQQRLESESTSKEDKAFLQYALKHGTEGAYEVRGVKEATTAEEMRNNIIQSGIDPEYGYVHKATERVNAIYDNFVEKWGKPADVQKAEEETIANVRNFAKKTYEERLQKEREEARSCTDDEIDENLVALEDFDNLPDSIDEYIASAEKSYGRISAVKALYGLSEPMSLTNWEITDNVKGMAARRAFLDEKAEREKNAEGGIRFRKGKKTALDTASGHQDGVHQPTVVSSADGAKIQQNLDKTAEKYINKVNQSKTFIGDVATALGAKRQGSSSEYVTFEAKNGKIVTLRLADHNAKVSTFDNRGEKEGISIVITAKKNGLMVDDGTAHVVEYFYDAIKLRRAEGKPLAEIIKAIKQSLYSGEFNDPTGLAVRQELNIPDGMNMDEETRFRFIGEKGAERLDKAQEATTRMDNLNVAREMEKSGKAPLAIKMATGWERGADGKWRYEQPDFKMKEGEDFYGLIDKAYDEYMTTVKAYEEIRKELNRIDNAIDRYPRRGRNEEQKAAVAELNKKRKKVAVQLDKAFNVKYEKSLAYDASKKTAEAKLSDWIEDDELFKAYPELAGIPIKVTYVHGSRGSFTPTPRGEEIGKIEMSNNLSPIQFKKTLVHEIQHAIQQIEGFARGGSSEAIGLVKERIEDADNAIAKKLDSFPEFTEWVESLSEEELLGLNKYSGKPYQMYYEWLEATGLDEEKLRLKQALDNATEYIEKSLEKIGMNYDEWWSKASWKEPFEIYKNLSGEVEARNASTRLNMTDEERRASLASDTEDVSRDDQLFLEDAMSGVSEMGSRVSKRMAEIGERLKGVKLDDNQRAVVDAFTGAADNTRFSVEREDGTHTIIMRQGNEGGAGTKHSIYRHYGTGIGVINADDLKLIPQILKDGAASKVNRGKTLLNVYEYTDSEGVVYKVVTEQVKGNEVFNDFYTNKKAPTSGSSNTLESARTDKAKDFDGAKVQQSSETPIGKDVNVPKGRRNAPPRPTAESVRKPVETPEQAAGELEKNGVTIIRSADELPEGHEALRAIREGDKVTGWFDPKTGRAYVYLPGIDSVDELMRTFRHEGVAHMGLRELLGREKFSSLCEDVWNDLMTQEDRDHYMAYVNGMSDKEYQRLSKEERKKMEANAGRRRAAADEFVAFMGEDGSYREPSMWRRVVDWVRSIIRKMGFKIKLTENDVKRLLRKAEVNAGLQDEDAIKEESGIRFRKVEDEETLRALNEGKTVKVFRAMQKQEGKYYPPMSGKVRSTVVGKNGKARTKWEWRDPIEMGSWEMAEERPDLANEDGTFTLDKGNGTKINAAYNPYIHTSRSPINDQFSSAWKRPELVTVEVEVPESELTSGYRAERAKDAVGEVEWKSGTVSNALAKTGDPRKVILSRYDRPVREVPVDEVAEEYARRLEGKDIEVPFNTVSPELRDALARRGVKIGAPEGGNAGGAAMKAYEAWSNGEDVPGEEGLRFRKGIGKVSDEEVSRENDPVEKMTGESSRSRAEKKRFAERERKRMRSRAEDIVNKLHISDDVEIVEDASEFGDERATAKGFFDTKTGKITVVLGNHASAMDVAKTVLHEAVSHYGLRKLFGKNFDSFLDNVFDNAEVDVRERIVDMSKKYNWGFREATEEYLGKLAEDTDFEGTNAGFWQKIKTAFLRMLHKIGLYEYGGPTISDNELRYILWRSYKNMEEPGRYRNLFDRAEDIATQDRLKVGEYEQKDADNVNDGEDSSIRFRRVGSDDMDLDKTITENSTALSDKYKEDKRLREDAIASINGNLTHLRQAMAEQRLFDARTVKGVADLARTLMTNGFMKNLHPGEVKDLISAIKNSVGKIQKVSGEEKVVGGEENYNYSVKRVFDITISSFEFT
jgi:hypothetical protein